MVVILLLLLLMGWIEAQPASAGISLEQQRIDREIAAERRHELKLAKIWAEAYKEAAKAQARQYRRDYYIQTRPHYKHLRPNRSK